MKPSISVWTVLDKFIEFIVFYTVIEIVIAIHHWQTHGGTWGDSWVHVASFQNVVPITASAFVALTVFYFCKNKILKIE